MDLGETVEWASGQVRVQGPPVWVFGLMSVLVVGSGAWVFERGSGWIVDLVVVVVLTVLGSNCQVGVETTGTFLR